MSRLSFYGINSSATEEHYGKSQIQKKRNQESSFHTILILVKVRKVTSPLTYTVVLHKPQIHQ